jgi:acyl-CoA dehydrogenase
MPDRTFLTWPFFDDTHRRFADALQAWATREIPTTHPPHEASALDTACRELVRALGAAGWLTYVVPKAYGGALDTFDVRTLCLARETLASVSGLADFTFALQGLGVGPITLFGSEHLKRRYLPNIAAGKSIGAFAISEEEAGSDVSAMRTTATRDGNDYIISGEKTWISNAGLADHYVVFARLDDDTGSTHTKQFIALVVDADNPGLHITRRIDVSAPHPLGTIRLDDCRVSADAVVGAPGKGLSVALGTLDVFRSTVGAAALGFARRALDETLIHVTQRPAAGGMLSELQLTQSRLAAMATDIDTSALLIYRAAWTRDMGATRITREAAMAKWHATEAAQRVIDGAVQLLGARGLVANTTVEQLYREVRALRIYEGTSEIQQLVIAGQLLAAHQNTSSRGTTV